MKPNKITSAAMALALAIVLGTSAHAQTYNTGDVLLGFEQSGSANDYEVDLGAFTQFADATSPVTLQLSVTDLNTAFGSTWSSNSTSVSDPDLVQWGAIGSGALHGVTTVGSTSLAADTLFYTVGEVTPGTQSTPPTEHSSTSQGTTVTQLVNATTGSGGFTSGTLTGNGTLQAIIQSATATNSYAYEINSKSDFEIGSDIQQPTSGSFTGPTDSVLDLYQLNPVNGGTASYLGDFSLSSGGTLTFDPAAVPEPSTYALMGVGAMFLIWNLRRKKANAL
jgi:hypothetical protein